MKRSPIVANVSCGWLDKREQIKSDKLTDWSGPNFAKLRECATTQWSGWGTSAPYSICIYKDDDAIQFAIASWGMSGYDNFFTFTKKDIHILNWRIKTPELLLWSVINKYGAKDIKLVLVKDREAQKREREGEIRREDECTERTRRIIERLVSEPRFVVTKKMAKQIMEPRCISSR